MSIMSYETITFEIQRPVATITLNRPDRLNALNQKMGEELQEAIAHCAADENVRAVVLTGTGRGFCTGGDVKAMRDHVGAGDPAAFFGDALATIHGAVLAIRRLPKPVIGAINGFASGAGFNLALACDLRIAADTARFNQAFVLVGLTPDAGGTYHLPRLVGLAKATELFFTGEMIDAAEALRLGIVNRVVPAAELPQAAADWAAQLAQGPTLALGRTKMLLNSALVEDLETQLEKERQSQVASGLTEDFREGLAAFFEKRPANFQGR